MAQVIGQYQGKDITAGTDAEVAAQMAKIRAIPAEDIQAVSPVAVPPVVDSAGQAVLSEVPQEAAQLKATTEADRQEYLAQQQQKQVDKERAELMAKVSEATDIMRSVPQREEEAGLPAERLAAAEIASQIEARELRLRREIENLEKRGGMSAGAMQSTINRMQTEAARELADLSIVQNAKLRRIEALETSIDRRMKLELEPLMFSLQFDQMFYQENREQLSKTQERAFQLRINQEEREYQEQMMVNQQIGQVAMTAAQYGANATQIGEIAKSRNYLEAIATGSRFLGAAFELQRTQIEMAIRERAENAIRQQLEQLESEEAEREEKAEVLLGIKQTLTGLNTHPGMSSAVGMGFKKSIIGRIPFVSGEAAEGTKRKDFEVMATRLSDMFLVDNLDKMTGVLTDKDLDVLRSDGTTIGNFDQSEDSWLDEYDRLMNMVNRGIQKNGISTEQAKFWYGVSEGDIDEVKSIYNLEPIPSFNPANFY